MSQRERWKRAWKRARQYGFRSAWSAACAGIEELRAVHVLRERDAHDPLRCAAELRRRLDRLGLLAIACIPCGRSVARP